MALADVGNPNRAVSVTAVTQLEYVTWLSTLVASKTQVRIPAIGDAESPRHGCVHAELRGPGDGIPAGVAPLAGGRSGVSRGIELRPSVVLYSGAPV